METKSILLSIGIPTWNRAYLLRVALERVGKQSLKFKNIIEIIISDNASTDNTQEVISEFADKYNLLKIITFKQERNTGYFGNFVKVRELAQGKFLWLLSDDDFIKDNLIEYIVHALKKFDDIGLVFLDMKCSKTYNSPELLIGEPESFNALFHRCGYKLTLISSVIFLNKKENDANLVNRFLNNSFIGFIFLLNSYRSLDNVISIYGDSLKKNQGKISFHVYNAWIDDMGIIIDYMKELKVPSRSVHKFVDDFLKNVLKQHYINSKLFGFQTESKKELREIEKRLIAQYSDYKGFQKAINKYIYKNRYLLILEFYVKKIIRKIGRELNIDRLKRCHI